MVMLVRPTHLQHEVFGCIVLRNVVSVMATAQSNQGVVAAGDQGWDQPAPQNFQWAETYLIHLGKAERTVLEGRARLQWTSWSQFKPEVSAGVPPVSAAAPDVPASADAQSHHDLIGELLASAAVCENLLFSADFQALDPCFEAPSPPSGPHPLALAVLSAAASFSFAPERIDTCVPSLCTSVILEIQLPA